jgi:predicted small secreted protein
MIRKILFLSLMLVYVGSMTACNTIEGVGKDVSKTGEGVQGASTAVKKKL